MAAEVLTEGEDFTAGAVDFTAVEVLTEAVDFTAGAVFTVAVDFTEAEVFAAEPRSVAALVAAASAGARDSAAALRFAQEPAFAAPASAAVFVTVSAADSAVAGGAGVAEVGAGA